MQSSQFWPQSTRFNANISINLPSAGTSTALSTYVASGAFHGHCHLFSVHHSDQPLEAQKRGVSVDVGIRTGSETFVIWSDPDHPILT